MPCRSLLTNHNTHTQPHSPHSGLQPQSRVAASSSLALRMMATAAPPKTELAKFTTKDYRVCAATT